VTGAVVIGAFSALERFLIDGRIVGGGKREGVEESEFGGLRVWVYINSGTMLNYIYAMDSNTVEDTSIKDSTDLTSIIKGMISVSSELRPEESQRRARGCPPWSQFQSTPRTYTHPSFLQYIYGHITIDAMRKKHSPEKENDTASPKISTMNPDPQRSDERISTRHAPEHKPTSV
jgi:hypothetical protein